MQKTNPELVNALIKEFEKISEKKIDINSYELYAALDEYQARSLVEQYPGMAVVKIRNDIGEIQYTVMQKDEAAKYVVTKMPALTEKEKLEITVETLKKIDRNAIGGQELYESVENFLNGGYIEGALSAIAIVAKKVPGGKQIYDKIEKALKKTDILDGTGEYKKVKGHHIHAKAAFKDSTKYDSKKGFSISQKFMKKYGLKHRDMTIYQRKAFKELSNSGRTNTLKEHTQIAVDALVAGGADKKLARKLVAESLNKLRVEGIKIPTNIPWYK